VEYGKLAGFKLVEAHRLADRAPAFVHEGRGLEQHDLFAADAPFLHPAGKFLLHGCEIVDFGNGVHRHEADIVPVHRILRARIAEADPELHRVIPGSRRHAPCAHDVAQHGSECKRRGKPDLDCRAVSSFTKR
jgi:hypothetical protein